MRRGKRQDERFTGLTVAIGAFGSLLFLPPFLSMFPNDARIGHLPAQWVYLFAAWAVVIAVLAFAVRRSR